MPGRAFAGTVVAEQVRSVDAMPTIADLLGVHLVERVDGASLVGVMKGEARREPPAAYAETFYPRLHYGWSELRSIRADGWKYIDAPKAELYNMKTDAAESRNQLDARAPLAAGLLAELQRVAGDSAASPPSRCHSRMPKRWRGFAASDTSASRRPRVRPEARIPRTWPRKSECSTRR